MIGTREATISYPLSEVIGALSHALDLTEGQPVGHAQRACMIGMELATRLDLPSDLRQQVFYASLLKDAGCSSSASRMAELFETDDGPLKREFSKVDWTSTGDFVRFTARHAKPGASGIARAAHVLRTLRAMAREAESLNHARCDRGARIVAMMGFPPGIAAAVRALDEHWDGSGRPDGVAGEAIPLVARIVCLSQTAEVFMTADCPRAALDVVRDRRGRWFDPHLCDAFLAIGPEDPLWLRLAGDNAAELLRALEPPESPALADEDGLDRVAEAFASVVDAKSPFTARHSQGVATYAVGIAEQLGWEAERIRSLRRAALLHDIGKLAISNRILDKPGRLTDAEMAEMRLHPVHTHAILSRISAFAPIADDAAAHHERLDGSGYHLGLPGELLSPEARILAAADVFEALTATRPYRGPSQPDEVLAMMDAEAGTGFDPEVLAALRAASALLDAAP